MAELKKSLSAGEVWAIALGSIIGSGCFLMPGHWIAKSGPGGVALGLFLGGLVCMLIGRAFGTMVRKIPVAGGPYVYAYESFGKNHAYLCGWFLALGYFSIVPANAVAFPYVVSSIIPNMNHGFLWTIEGFDVYFSQVAISLTVLAVFAVLNYKGGRFAGAVQLLIVVLLVGSVVLIGAAALLHPGTSLANARPWFPEGKSAIAAFLAIFAIAPMAYVGFDTIPQASEEFKFESGKAMKLIIVSILAGALMYVTVLLSTAIALPEGISSWKEFVANKQIWHTKESMAYVLGKFGVVVLGTGVIMAMLGGINGFYIATSRLLLSMARSKMLPSWFAKIHPKYGTPSNGIFFVFALSAVIVWFGKPVLGWVVDMASVGIAFGYGYTCLAALKHTKSDIGEKARWTHAAGFLVSCFFMVLMVVPGMPAFLSAPCWIALVLWMIAGIVFYISMKKHNKNIPEDVILAELLQTGKKAEKTA
jgi:amino acid transporter